MDSAPPLLKPTTFLAHEVQQKTGKHNTSITVAECWVPSRWRKSIGFGREEGIISSGFVKADLEGQTDPDRADILWDTSSVMKLVVTVLQQCCLECLVNPTVRSSLIELKFGRGVVNWCILDLYGGISLWLPESL
ncbi:hypothetical protein DY000_02029219 [Brassica cretica]|uniref:Uncharacterized protein n=1 Tax=Brassica cretica TaxID=69181 RepID=A0ABQ7DVL0_BRACR|nr:hypothetical protein DY000_02029219 [Brassica cretica]